MDRRKGSGVIVLRLLTPFFLPSAEEYIRLATSIACDSSFRASLQQRLLQHNSILFADPAEVRAFEECLKSIV